MRVRAFDLVAASALALLGSMLGCGGSSVRHGDDAQDDDGAFTTGGIAGTRGGTSGEELGGSVGTGGFSGDNFPGGGVSSGGVPTGGVGGVGLGGSAGSGASAGLGASAGVPLCDDPDEARGVVVSVQVRGSATGVNGTLSDSCNAQGNLVETVCEKVCLGPPSNTEDPGSWLRIRCATVPSGQVIQTELDCGGRCVDGACFQWCPVAGVLLRVSEVAPGSVKLTGTNGYEYDCVPTGVDIDVDCDGEEILGRWLEAVDSLLTTNCTNDVVSFAVDDPVNGAGVDCGYRCTFH